MTEDEILRLWKAFDELGYDYEQVKSLALTLLLRGYGEKGYKNLYELLVDCKLNYQENGNLIN